MDLKQHYNNLYQDSITKYKTDNYEFDKLIDSPTDSRFGITLLIRPHQKIKNKINDFLLNLKKIEPNQYYYPKSDIHITVMSIISCYHGFKLSQIDKNIYIETIHQCLSNIPSFSIQFKGLTASPSCIMVQGFLTDNTLKQIRNNLRTNFKNSDLQHSIDKRYTIQTAHSTIFRLKNKLNNKEKFLDLIEQYQNYEFGTFRVNSLELVFNDWYQRADKVQKLHEFMLKTEPNTLYK
ncbi:2'-5' RNA ligase family protein [Ochrovirga pacifica]|uniref:2'-5' RNA ligase family protein n=1 Tax=Ochrovirga pacifica TaxID=1042376 RepID=UPI0002557762|nr:mutarotase [Ochrovirga pacifica]